MPTVDASNPRLRLGLLRPSIAEIDAILALVHSMSISRNMYPVQSIPPATFWRDDVWCHNGRPLSLAVVGRFAADLTLRSSQDGQTDLFVVPIRRIDTERIQSLLASAGHQIGAFDVVINTLTLTPYRSHRSC